MNIPKSFKLMGHTMTVELIAPKDWKFKDSVGYFDTKAYVIGVRKCRPSQMHHIFMHELTHAVLCVMSHDLYEDENFVDTFGGLMSQALNTAKFAAPIRRKRKSK